MKRMLVRLIGLSGIGSRKGTQLLKKRENHLSTCHRTGEAFVSEWEWKHLGHMGIGS